MKISSFVIALLCSTGCAAIAAPITYVAALSGSSESPANSSPGTGFVDVIFDASAQTLSVNATFSGLTSNTTASHIHCCTATPLTGDAGVATQVPSFPGFPLGVTSGTFNAVFDMSLLSSYNPAFVTANGGTAASAETAFGAGLAAGETYFNIHTTAFPNGEIRGYLVATPEPATFGIAGVAALAGLLLRRRRAA